MHYLPNKKFILIAAISLLIVGGGFLILKNYGPEKQQQISEQQLLSGSEMAIVQEIDKDSDNDSLKDWQETLWNTDPKNPDTDKDGALDGQEVKENRNPLLAGNGITDKIKSPQPEKSDATDLEQTIQAPPTLTEALSQGILNQYMSLQQENNAPLSETDQEGIINSAISALDNIQKNTNQNANDYLESDIKIAATDDEKTIKDYGNNLALIVKKYFDPLPETEMTIFSKAMEENQALSEPNEDELKKLEPIADAYRNTAQEMIYLTTPAGFSKSHLELINYFNNIAKEINELQRFFKDPVQATLIFPRYQEDAGKAYLILLKLNAYFSKNKVVFEENEPAEYFKIYVAAAEAKTKQ